MTAAIENIAPTIHSTEELRQFILSHPDRPVMLYLTGVEPDGRTPCPACVHFEHDRQAELNDHGRGNPPRVNFVQLPMPVGGGAAPVWQQTMRELGGNLNMTNFNLEFPGVAAVSAGTPKLLQVTIGADGQLQVVEAIDSPNSPDLNARLTGIEARHAVRTPGGGTTVPHAAVAPDPTQVRR